MTLIAYTHNKYRLGWWAAGAVSCLLVGLVAYGVSQDQTRSTKLASPIAASAANPEKGKPAGRDLMLEQEGLAMATPAGDPRSPVDSVLPPVFQADTSGNLIKDETARVDIERLLALNERSVALRKLREASAALPPAAQQELRMLFMRYEQYRVAQLQYLESANTATEEPSLEVMEHELEALSQLRQSYFGSQDSQALFGAEEAATKRLNQLIRTQTDPALPLSRRAEIAQTLWDRERNTATEGKAP